MIVISLGESIRGDLPHAAGVGEGLQHTAEMKPIQVSPELT